MLMPFSNFCQKFLGQCQWLCFAPSCSKTMFAIRQYVMLLDVFKNVAGYHMLLDIATLASEENRSVIAGLEYLTILRKQNSSYISFPPILWYIASI